MWKMQKFQKKFMMKYQKILTTFKAEDNFLYKYSLYITDENKKYISNDENYNKMLRGTTLTESLYKYKIGEIEAVADETQKPSEIN